MKKAMIMLPVVLLIILVLSVVFYGALYLIKIKNRITPTTITFDSYAYTTTYLESILLDTYCTSINNINKPFIEALHIKEVRECMENILQQYTSQSTYALSSLEIKSDGQTLFYYKSDKHKEYYKTSYSFNVIINSTLKTIEVEVAYGKAN